MSGCADARKARAGGVGEDLGVESGISGGKSNLGKRFLRDAFDMLVAIDKL
jgi:hypothetical protein